MKLMKKLILGLAAASLYALVPVFSECPNASAEPAAPTQAITPTATEIIAAHGAVRNQAQKETK